MSLFLFILIGNLPGSGHKHQADHVERHATRSGSVIQLHPSEVTFQIPEAWIGSGTSFHLTRRELHKARHDPWLNKVEDAALDFSDCAVQVNIGSTVWLRAYVITQPENAIIKRIQEKAPQALRKTPNYVPVRRFQLEPAKEGPWQHIEMPFVLNFGDYNEDGDISFYVEPMSGRQLVIVVGYIGNHHPRVEDETLEVLKSVVIPAQP
ncbi:MAG TPA: hypothetical protein VEW69_05140 [Alphaproteobacteria bacterium]|nr:hypothetical protein [Alphaproteobacteria bacterium]